MNLFGLSGLGSFLNARRRYHLHGDLWLGKHKVGIRRLTLERHDSSDDAAFFLYFHEGEHGPGHGFISRIHELTVAKPNKWVEFRVGKLRVKVLRDDLLLALAALA